MKDVQDAEPIAVEAQHGSKTIWVNVCFFTNNIAEEPGMVIPKHAWDVGFAYIQRNDAHGIERGKGTPFHSLTELSSVIEDELLKARVTIVPGRKTRKLIRQS